MDDMNRILDKIKKLLARADADRNDNEHERAIAMRQAASLMAKHGLDMSDIGNDDTSTFGPMGSVEIKTGQVDKWVTSVYWSIARLNGCTTLRMQGKSMKIFGRAMRVTVARQMADYVIASVMREAQAVKTDYPHIHGRQFTKDFGDGAASGVHLQVDKILEAQKRGDLGDEQLSSSRALVLVNQHALALREANALMHSMHSVRKGTGTMTRRNDAYAHGKYYGSNISLNAQIKKG